MDRDWNQAAHVLLVAGPKEGPGLVGPWIHAGLRTEARVICPRPEASAPTTSLALLTDPAEHRWGFDDATASGQLLVVPAADFYPPGKVALLAEAARRDGYAGVRMVGEAVTALAMLGPRGYRRLEEDFESLTGQDGTAVLCIYDPERVSVDVTCSNTSLHRSGIDSELFRLTSSNEGLRLAGEVDGSIAQIVEAVLRELLTDVSGPQVRLEVGGLTFCDAAGARALIDGTAPARAGGLEVQLTHPTPSVHRVLSLVGPDEGDGIEVVGPRS